MSEPQSQKKKKNKKKKKSTKKPSAEGNSSQLNPTSDGSNPECDGFNINEVLPQKVGMKTIFKDVEVTMTHDGNVKEVANGPSKKKKKKKKSKQAPIETSQEANPSEADPQNNFFKFSEDHIELVNHPEISVTFSKSAGNQEKEASKTEEKVSVISDLKEQPEVVAPGTDIKKKKKKKKKKKTTTTTNDNNANNNVNLTSDLTPDSADASYKAPTYVKLPAAGDSCVLVVSHESFSGDNKVSENTETTSTANSGSTVLIKNKNKVEESNPISRLSPEIQPGPSVSIFPVMPGPNKSPLEKTGEINMDSSLQKVSELMKKEVDADDSPALDITKDKPGNSEEPVLTKAQLKAERRAKQEAQRAAKLSKNTVKDVPSAQVAAQNQVSTESTKPAPPVKQSSPEISESTKSKSVSKPLPEKETFRKFQIFSHLPQCKDLSSKQISDKSSKIHPAIIALGSHFSKGVLCGSNARCVGFLAAFRDVVKDYNTSPNKDFSRDLESKLKTYLNYLNSCRPLSISITNAVRFLKHQINHTPKEMNEESAKERLCASINNFVREEILLAKEAICITASDTIFNGDTILVYAYSSLVKDVLCKAHDQNKSFHVIVIDSRPKLEGLEMLRRLVRHGIRCSYASIDSAYYVMQKVSKVIIGAHALLLNGFVMSRLGCKQIALLASSYSVPVFVCCETYKFCDRALSDSFVHNELGKPEDLVQISLNKNESLKNWQSLPSLQMYNILYDVTPSDLISVVITEKGILPCTAVPVVLRVKYAGLQDISN